MIRDITIGQYYPQDSVIHRLDSRIKLMATVLYIVSLFVVKGYVGYTYASIWLFTLIILSKVPIGYILKGIKSIIVIIIFTVIINVFTTKGETILFKTGWVTVTLEGVIFAFTMCYRLILLIMGSSLMTLTSTPIQLTDGIEYLLKPLKRIGVPSHEIAMMMTIALRFIPTLLEETDKIIKAQQARGADFETGNFIHRAKSLVPILVPLFISSFRRADELAMAMEARCYHGDENRTRMNEMKLNKSDIVAVLLISIYFLVAVLLRVVL